MHVCQLQRTLRLARPIRETSVVRAYRSRFCDNVVIALLKYTEGCRVTFSEPENMLIYHLNMSDAKSSGSAVICSGSASLGDEIAESPPEGFCQVSRMRTCDSLPSLRLGWPNMTSIPKCSVEVPKRQLVGDNPAIKLNDPTSIRSSSSRCLLISSAARNKVSV